MAYKAEARGWKRTLRPASRLRRGAAGLPAAAWAAGFGVPVGCPVRTSGRQSRWAWYGQPLFPSDQETPEWLSANRSKRLPPSGGRRVTWPRHRSKPRRWFTAQRSASCRRPMAGTSTVWRGACTGEAAMGTHSRSAGRHGNGSRSPGPARWRISQAGASTGRIWHPCPAITVRLGTTVLASSRRKRGRGPSRRRSRLRKPSAI